MNTVPRILFASRHQLSKEQESDLDSIFDEHYEVTQESIQFNTVEDVYKLLTEYDVVIAVLPQFICASIYKTYGQYMEAYYRGEPVHPDDEKGHLVSKLWFSKSEPTVNEKDGSRIFKHIGFFNADCSKVNKYYGE